MVLIDQVTWYPNATFIAFIKHLSAFYNEVVAIFFEIFKFIGGIAKATADLNDII